MKTITMTELRTQVQASKRRIGWLDDEAALEALRNPGLNRTPAKRELLARIDERARAAGVKPIPSKY